MNWERPPRQALHSWIQFPVSGSWPVKSWPWHSHACSISFFHFLICSIFCVSKSVKYIFDLLHFISTQSKKSVHFYCFKSASILKYFPYFNSLKAFILLRITSFVIQHSHIITFYWSNLTWILQFWVTFAALFY